MSEELIAILREQVFRQEREIETLNKRLDEQARMLSDAIHVTAATISAAESRRAANAKRQQEYRDRRLAVMHQTNGADALRDNNVTRNVTPEVVKAFEAKEQEPKQEQLLRTTTKATTSGVTLRRNITRATWEAYRTAYAKRYSVPPLPNATQNSKMLQFVKRVGEEEAPEIAAWFVGHPDAFYVRNLHSVGLLLRDCESLRTQWATGRDMTHTKARQEDRTATNVDGWLNIPYAGAK